MMLMSSGPSGHYLDSELAPEIQRRMTNCAELKQSHRMVTARQHVVEGVVTGIISGAVADRDGEKHGVPLPLIIVPRNGTCFM